MSLRQTRPESVVLDSWMEGDIGKMLGALATYALWEGSGTGERVRDALAAVYAQLVVAEVRDEGERERPLAESIKAEWTDE